MNVDAGGPVPTRMRASVLTGRGAITLAERPVPAPAADEVLVRVASVGVCGSDVHYYREGRIGDLVVEGPLILGHEAAGVIVRTGESVPADRVGQRVAIEPQYPCRRCRYCKTGRLNLCPDMRFYATPPVDGAFCEYVTIAADFAHPVPEGLSWDAAALLEPLSVGVWACRKARVRAGSTVLIAGAGPIGAVTAIAARAAGATSVVVSDPVAARRASIARFGATDTYDPVTGPPAGEFDAFVDCSGAPAAVRAGIGAVAGDGWAVLVGMGADELALPVSAVQRREVNITGVFRYVDTWPTAVGIAAGPYSLDDLVTARFALSEVESALTADTDVDSLKSIVEPWR